MQHLSVVPRCEGLLGPDPSETRINWIEGTVQEPACDREEVLTCLRKRTVVIATQCSLISACIPLPVIVYLNRAVQLLGRLCSVRVHTSGTGTLPSQIKQ